MEEEVLRVIRNGPTWEPAVQNGQKVTAYRKQPITFIVVDDEETSNPNFPLAAFVYLLRSDEGHKLKANEIKSVTELKLYKAKSVADCEIISFRITFGEDERIIELHNKGSKFNKTLQNFIKTIQSPTLITIDDILVKTGNEIKKLPPKIYFAF